MNDSSVPPGAERLIRWIMAAIVVWHFHSQERVYHDVIVQVSDDKDKTEEQYGVRLVVDKMSAPYLTQATIDFVDTLTPQTALITWRPKNGTIDTQMRRAAPPITNCRPTRIITWRLRSFACSLFASSEVSVRLGTW